MQEITSIALNTVFCGSTLLSQNCVSGLFVSLNKMMVTTKPLDFWFNTDFIQLSLFCRRWLWILTSDLKPTKSVGMSLKSTENLWLKRFLIIGQETHCFGINKCINTLLCNFIKNSGRSSFPRDARSPKQFISTWHCHFCTKLLFYHLSPYIWLLGFFCFGFFFF